MHALRDAIRIAPDCPVQTIEVPEWGVSIAVRPLTAAEADTLRPVAKDPLELALRALVLVAEDPDVPGIRLFASEDVEWLRNKSRRVIDALTSPILLASFVPVDDAEKN